MENIFSQIGEASYTAIGFFWKALWAFILGYGISGAIQAFVPRNKLAKRMGKSNFKSVGLASGFGAISSSCSFAALSAAKSLVIKGANFVAAVAFMFASTNLVIELGIMILIFLGPSFLVAEIIGGLVLITFSSLIIKATYPKKWFDEAREKVEEENQNEEDDFNPWERMKSYEGWKMVGTNFVGEWKMVWQEVLIGFTIAGFIKVFVPDSFWKAIFLMEMKDQIPQFLITLENALVAPFVAASTFIGSMGNIPLATVLAGSGVAFAGIMGFIYSDLMVPPLVKINAKYYGWRVALYIAGVMFVSIIVTSMLLHYGFEIFGVLPDTSQSKSQSDHFAIDYTFFFNIAFFIIGGLLVFLNIRQKRDKNKEDGHDHSSKKISLQDGITYFFMTVLAVGMVIHLFV